MTAFEDLTLIVRGLALIAPNDVWREVDHGEEVAACVLCGARARLESRRREPGRIDHFWNGSHAPTCPWEQARRWVAANPPPPPAELALHMTGEGQ